MIREMREGGLFIQKYICFPTLSDVNLVECGKRERCVGYKYAECFRPYYYFSIIREGKIALHCNSGTYTLQEGTLYVMFANTASISYEVDANVPYSVSWIGVYGSMLPLFLNQLGITEEKPFLRLSNSETVSQIVDDMIAMDENDTIAVNMAYISKLYQYFSMLYQEMAVYDTKGYVEQGIEYISAMYSTGISSGDVAHFVGIDRSYFSMLFKRIIGVSPSDYLKNLRVKRSIDLLMTTEMSIADIASAVGIQDESYFSRIFSKVVGLSPIQYKRQNVRKED